MPENNQETPEERREEKRESISSTRQEELQYIYNNQHRIV